MESLGDRSFMCLVSGDKPAIEYISVPGGSLLGHRIDCQDLTLSNANHSYDLTTRQHELCKQSRYHSWSWVDRCVNGRGMFPFR